MLTRDGTSDLRAGDEGRTRDGPGRAFWWAVAAIGAAAAYGLGATLDVMEIDAAQYAAIARHVADSGTWLEITDRGEPFLNKPPLLFWTSGLSFLAFGVSDVSYRLPSVLVFVLGVYATYRLATRYGGKRAGWCAALVLATCQGAFLMNQDVRTDTLLTGVVAFSLWRLAEFLERPGLGNAALLGAGLGAGMLSKGVIGLVVPLLGAAAHLAARREWRRALRREWAVALGIALLLLAPMAVGLVRQHGAAGLVFMFWTQGLGRVLGENIWGDAHGPFFFVPQLAWIFLPWTPFLVAALWARARDLRAAGWRLSAGHEAITLGAFALGFIGISLSRSKLPHYVYVTLPAAAVLTGTWLAAWLGEGGRGRLAALQAALLALLWLATVALLAWAFPSRSALLWAGLAVLAVGTGRALIGGRRRRAAVVLASALTIAAVNLALNGGIYPRLLAYQATSAAGRLVRTLEGGGASRPGEAPPSGPLIAYRVGGHALDFYARRVATPLDQADEVRARVRREGPAWVFTDSAGARDLVAGGLDTVTVGAYRHFRVAKLTGRFLDPATREGTTRPRLLLRVE